MPCYHTLYCTQHCREILTNGHLVEVTLLQPIRPKLVLCHTGLYDVSLIVSNTLGSDTLLLQGYLTLGTTPEAEFEHTGNWRAGGFWNFQAPVKSVFWDFAGLALQTISTKFWFSCQWQLSCNLNCIQWLWKWHHRSCCKCGGIFYPKWSLGRT